jgi:hypothetical protein
MKDYLSDFKYKGLSKLPWSNETTLYHMAFDEEDIIYYDIKGLHIRYIAQESP